MQYRFPKGLRPATVEEREQFYRDHFTFDQADDFLARWQDPDFAIDVGTETTRYRPKWKKYLDKLVYIRNYTNRRGLTQKLVRYAPEDLYYVRQSSDGTEQELCLDIDPENTDCRSCTHFRKKHEGKPKVYSFCTNCFSTAAEHCKQLFNILETHFDDVRVLYTGRGFHLRVLDDEAYLMERSDRERFAHQLEQDDFPVDTWVTKGSIDILRLPGSLHGLVSRVTTEISVDALEEPEHILETVGVPPFIKTGKKR